MAISGLASVIFSRDWETLGAGLLVGLFLWPAIVADRIAVYCGLRPSHARLLYAGAVLLVCLVFAIPAVPLYTSPEPAAIDMARFLLSVYAVAAVAMLFYLQHSDRWAAHKRISRVDKDNASSSSAP